MNFDIKEVADTCVAVIWSCLVLLVFNSEPIVIAALIGASLVNWVVSSILIYIDNLSTYDDMIQQNILSEMPTPKNMVVTSILYPIFRLYIFLTTDIVKMYNILINKI